MTDTLPADTLSRLAAIIGQRRAASPKESHTAMLMAKGRAKIAQKVGEEAIETVIAAVQGDRAALIAESADLLFHLSILWVDAEITPADIDSELKLRETRSGVAEKASRKS